MACFKLELFCSLKFKIEYKYSDSKKKVLSVWLLLGYIFTK